MQKGLPFDLTTEWVQERLDRGTCEVTGIAFSFSTKRGWNTPSLDQIVPSGGYTQKNTRLILFGLNAAFGNWGEQRMIEMASAILRKRREKSQALSTALGEALKRQTDGLGSTLYKLTWKTRVTPSGLSISALRASARPTSGNGSGGSESGWPTPVVTDGANARNSTALRHNVDSKHHSGTTMLDAASMAGWPSPTTPSGGQAPPEGTSATGMTPNGRKVQVTLKDLAAMAGWPTPQTHDVTRRGNTNADHHSFPHDLSNMADWCDQAARLTVSGELLTGSTAGMESGGQLNPAHSRWLMGLPSVWDSSGVTAMLLLRQQRKPSSRRTSKRKPIDIFS